MLPLSHLTDFLESFAPAALAEEWDNVGLLVGERGRDVARVMTCLTISPTVVVEAIADKVDLIVTHHPLPFRPLNRLTDDKPEGRMLHKLIAAGVAIYSPHTAFDSAREGINQQLAEGLQLTNIAPIVPHATMSEIGGGRWGVFWEPITLTDLTQRAKKFLQIEQVQFVGDPQRTMQRVAVACGSAGEFLAAAREVGCDALVTGEVRFHTALEAESTEIALLLTGHYASERFGVERLAKVLSAQFPQLTIWPSHVERDPLAWG